MNIPSNGFIGARKQRPAQPESFFAKHGITIEQSGNHRRMLIGASTALIQRDQEFTVVGTDGDKKFEMKLNDRTWLTFQHSGDEKHEQFDLIIEDRARCIGNAQNYVVEFAVLHGSYGSDTLARMAFDWESIAKRYNR